MTMKDSLITTCRRNSSRIAGRCRKVLSYVERRLYVPPQAARVHQWWAADPQEKQRYEYDLTSDSLVFDLGGYRGQWASDIFARYSCRVEVFEPVPHYARDIEKRFAGNPKISVHEFGLAGRTGESSIAISDDRSSLYGSDGEPCVIKLVQAKSFLEDLGNPRISLMKINIEGGEYELLQHLLDNDLIKHIDNIQVQFHDEVVPNAAERMHRLQQRLSESHEPTYQFPFVWENWRLRTNSGRTALQSRCAA